MAAAMVTKSLADCERPNQWKPGGRFCTQAPCVIQRRPSRRATMAARVTTMEGMRTHATSTPLRAPNSKPTSVASAMAASVGNPATAKTPAATLQIANWEPTEISICAVMTISVMPTATISTGTFASSRSRRLARVKKPGARMARTAAMAKMTASMESSRRRLRSMVNGASQSEREQLLLRGVFSFEHAGDAACMHHRNTIAHTENLRHFRRDHENRKTLLREIDNEAVNLRFRANIDAL